MTLCGTFEDTNLGNSLAAVECCLRYEDCTALTSLVKNNESSSALNLSSSQTVFVERIAEEVPREKFVWYGGQPGDDYE